MQVYKVYKYKKWLENKRTKSRGRDWVVNHLLITMSDVVVNFFEKKKNVQCTSKTCQSNWVYHLGNCNLKQKRSWTDSKRLLFQWLDLSTSAVPWKLQFSRKGFDDGRKKNPVSFTLNNRLLSFKEEHLVTVRTLCRSKILIKFVSYEFPFRHHHECKIDV